VEEEEKVERERKRGRTMKENGTLNPGDELNGPRTRIKGREEEEGEEEEKDGGKDAPVMGVVFRMRPGIGWDWQSREEKGARGEEGGGMRWGDDESNHTHGQGAYKGRADPVCVSKQLLRGVLRPG